MKPNYLLTSMLAVAAVVVTSCSAPKLAQQGNVNDDVYGTTAQAKEYTAPKPQIANNEDNDGWDMDDYGTSDPYSDMDYYSRINRFRYGSPFMSYYDPFYSGFYGYSGFSPYYSSGLSLGFGLGFGWGSSFYGGYDPYLWNAYNSPFWGFNNYYGGAYGGFYGNPYYGGGYYGGGFGSGYYGGLYSSNSNRAPRPARGRENGVGYNGSPNYNNGQRTTRTTNGVTTTSQGRAARSTNGSNSSNGNTQSSRPTRGETYTPPARTENRPTYTPPPSYDGGGRGGSGGGGGGSTGSRGSRGGRN